MQVDYCMKGVTMVDILLVEDNNELGELITTFLKKEQFSVFLAESGEKAIDFLRSDIARLVLLDIMLPGVDGFSVCTTIRETKDIPIIIMSAKTEKEDRMNGFILGADDYITKPVDIDLLIAKIGAIMRRNYEMKYKNTILSSGAVSIDKDAMQAYFHEKPLNLTVKEYELLYLLASNPGKTLHKDYLFNQIWGADSFSENQTLTVHIKMLRDKIEDSPKNPKRIITVWGVGYKYEEI